MSDQVRNLEPKILWNHFADLNAVPRASKNEERVISFMKSFGASLGLETLVDETGNVIIKKPASPGMESKQIVALQSHLDMVHQKNADTDFDFDTQGIDMFVDGDWVKARGTTLGADNGIGVAAIMALLSSTDIAHPPLEALFTIDEETGMTGAEGLKGGVLNAPVLLNLDTEDDDELTIGCAGGIDVTASGTYEQVEQPSETIFFDVELIGLTGGHSGGDIHLGRGNANKLMNRFLQMVSESTDLGILSIDGGGLRNAIPRESKAIISVPRSSHNDLDGLVREFNTILRGEYSTTDPEAKLKVEISKASGRIMDQEFMNKLLRSVAACPNGIYRMSPDIEGLVQTSNNVARILIENGKYEILCLTRSSVNSEKFDEVRSIKSCFELMGAEVSTSGDYPGWTPNPEAVIVKTMQELYVELFSQEAKVSAVHAGLECGILGRNYPNMEMISFGPNIRGAHSPDEKAQISSVHKFWGFLLETLKRTP